MTTFWVVEHFDAIEHISPIGVAQDKERAVHWYRKAAKQGDPNAQEALEKLGFDWENSAP